MSATIDADKLSKYFDDCPMMHIEGLAYPVKDIYLEEILNMTKFQLPEEQRRPEKPWHKHRKLNKSMETFSAKEIRYRAEIGTYFFISFLVVNILITTMSFLILSQVGVLSRHLCYKLSSSKPPVDLFTAIMHCNVTYWRFQLTNHFFNLTPTKIEFYI